MRDPRDGQIHDRELRLFAPAGRGVIVEIDEPAARPLQPLDEGARRIVQARRRGSVHPAELVKVLAPERRDVPRARSRAASSSSTTSTPTDTSCPSTARRR